MGTPCLEGGGGGGRRLFRHVPVSSHGQSKGKDRAETTATYSVNSKLRYFLNCSRSRLVHKRQSILETLLGRGKMTCSKRQRVRVSEVPREGLTLACTVRFDILFLKLLDVFRTDTLLDHCPEMSSLHAQQYVVILQGATWRRSSILVNSTHNFPSISSRFKYIFATFKLLNLYDTVCCLIVRFVTLSVSP